MFYILSNYPMEYESNNTGVPRYVENPEWTRLKLKTEIESITLTIESHEERLVELRKILKEKKSQLEDT